MHPPTPPLPLSHSQLLFSPPPPPCPFHDPYLLQDCPKPQLGHKSNPASPLSSLYPTQGSPPRPKSFPPLSRIFQQHVCLSLRLVRIICAAHVASHVCTPSPNAYLAICLTVSFHLSEKSISCASLYQPVLWRVAHHRSGLPIPRAGCWSMHLQNACHTCQAAIR